MNENTKHLHIEDEETIGLIKKVLNNLGENCENQTIVFIKQHTVPNPWPVNVNDYGFTPTIGMRLKVEYLGSRPTGEKLYNISLVSPFTNPYIINPYNDNIGYGFDVKVSKEPNEYFVTTLYDSLRMNPRTAPMNAANPWAHNCYSISQLEEMHMLGTASKFVNGFLKYLDLAYLKKNSCDGKSVLESSSKENNYIASYLGYNLNLGDYKERYVYDEPGDLMKALISRIPEVEMLFKAVDYIASNDTSDGNIYETRDKLKDFLYGVMNDHINLRAIKGEQYDFNNPVRWNDKVDKYSGEKGYFEYTQNKSCERESDEQEEEEVEN